MTDNLENKTNDSYSALRNLAGYAAIGGAAYLLLHTQPGSAEFSTNMQYVLGLVALATIIQKK